MIVTSAAVPQVVGRAITGTLFLVVLATPSRDFISAKLGLFFTIPIAFAVSITEAKLLLAIYRENREKLYS